MPELSEDNPDNIALKRPRDAQPVATSYRHEPKGCPMLISRATIAGTLLMASLAVAAGSLAAGSRIANAQTSQMTDEQVQQKLQSAGYTNIQIVGHESRRIEATAQKNGATQKLVVDPQTGAIAANKDDDD
jgi:hypothetical protein